MAAEAFPFFLDFGGADGGSPDADSAGSIFDRLFRRFAEGSAGDSGAVEACSGLGSGAVAFRFLDEAFGAEGAGVDGGCWLLESGLGEPAESLAAERVTLEDMRVRLGWGMHSEESVHQRSCVR